MKFSFFKIVVCFLLLMFVFPKFADAQQDGMFKGKHKDKHRRRGRREKKNKTAYNPYIDHDTNKSKKLATKDMQKDEKKVARKQKREIRRGKRWFNRKKGMSYNTK